MLDSPQITPQLWTSYSTSKNGFNIYTFHSKWINSVDVGMRLAFRYITSREQNRFQFKVKVCFHLLYTYLIYFDFYAWSIHLSLEKWIDWTDVIHLRCNQYLMIITNSRLQIIQEGPQEIQSTRERKNLIFSASCGRAAGDRLHWLLTGVNKGKSD